ncbi:MAG: BREX system P-loop protein BrxC, partial [Spirulina sp. DLM2.Bin59]
MKLHQIFAKPVDRAIEGVIKADDAASLPLELEEYVLTQEVQQRLDGFLAAYNDYRGANGVWISGFFGSGKSHLLKMLAVLLENREVGGQRAFTYFEGKCEGDRLLAANLKKAVALPSRSILFNIDQKATVSSKQAEFDALLSVFFQVFHEMQGYYGKLGYIAQFERDLDSRGQYDAFRVAYGEIAGKPWEKGREQAVMEKRNIAQAYGQITGVSGVGDGILEQYRQDYRVSIEDFADEVWAYLQRQERGFRLNFFVDEVGQYIAGNIKLMTNLQTIAESLATKCQGQAWILVTAQEDMDTVLGAEGKQQSNDFSKIQDRFKNRMKLTSQNVAEVIQTRLLLKTTASEAALKALYASHQNNFKTLFDFADGSKTFRTFKDGDHFIKTYPFIPYQFELFKTAIEQLSQHSAFEGKHSSVGERSMLGVFQAVVVCLREGEVGQLATFDLMFEGIRTTLKSMIQAAILSAERNLGDDFAVRVLKALFLVKYVREFKATVRNVCVLMREGLEQNPTDLEAQVQGALNRLEQESYVQRNGELYEYLTDEEKDIEKEIKNVEVDRNNILTELNQLIVKGTLIPKKIRHGNDQDYDFTTVIDDQRYGNVHELTLHVITPLYPDGDNEAVLQAQTMGKAELRVVLPPDARLMRDLELWLQTETYIRQQTGKPHTSSIQQIINQKQLQNDERKRGLTVRLAESLAEATLILNGAVLCHQGQGRLMAAFEDLITQTYPHLLMLRNETYTKERVQQVLSPGQPGIFGDLTEPEQEVLNFIQRTKNAGGRSTVKSLQEQFRSKPYGWQDLAVLFFVAVLVVRGKVQPPAYGHILVGERVGTGLLGRGQQGNVILRPQAV